MPTRLVQLEHHPSGTAVFTVVGQAQSQLPIPEDLEIAIVQGGALDRYLDPRNPRAPWSASVFRFRPVSGRRENNQLLLEIDHGVTYHIQPNQPYKLQIRQVAGLEIEERFTGPAVMRRPGPLPEGWQPPGQPDGPLTVPEPVAAAPVEAAPEPVVEPPVAEAPIVIDEPVLVAPPPVDPPKVDPPPIVAPPKKSSRLGLVAVLVLLIAAGAGWFLFGRKPATEVAAADPAASAASAPASMGTLDAVRDYVSKDPSPDDALAQADKLAAGNQLLQGQMLLYKYAGEKGNAQAARHMGLFYDPDTWTAEKSPFPAPNQVEAARWHLQAAQAGDAESQYRYGMLLKKGRTDLPDGPEQAVAWLRKAADQGHAEAKAALGS